MSGYSRVSLGRISAAGAEVARTKTVNPAIKAGRCIRCMWVLPCSQPSIGSFPGAERSRRKDAKHGATANGPTHPNLTGPGQSRGASTRYQGHALRAPAVRGQSWAKVTTRRLGNIGPGTEWIASESILGVGRD